MPGKIKIHNAAITKGAFLKSFPLSPTTEVTEFIRSGSDTVETEEFGSSVDMSKDGTKIAVGARAGGGELDGGGTILTNESGEAYVFAWDGVDWVEEQKLPDPPGHASYTYFGYCVKFNSNHTRLFVSAIEASAPGTLTTKNGIVYEYINDGSSWNYNNYIMNNDLITGAEFGSSIEFNDATNRLVVGAPGRRFAPSGSLLYSYGFAYVFDWDGSDWIPTRLEQSVGGENWNFGQSLAISDDGTRIAVAAPGSSAIGDILGNVFVFDLISGSWTETARIEPVDGVINGLFGSSISLSSDGNRIAVAAKRDENAGFTVPGSIYIYNWDGVNWILEQKILPDPDISQTNFAEKVILSGDGSKLVANYATLWPQADEAIVEIHSRSNGVWTKNNEIISSSNNLNMHYGEDLSVSEDFSRLVVGSHYGPYDDGAMSYPGVIHIFHNT